MVATKRRFNPNLQRVRVLLGGKATRAYVCTRCLKGGKVQKALALASGRHPHLRRRRSNAARGGRFHPLVRSLGRITIAGDAVAQIVGHDRSSSATASSGWPPAAARRPAALSRQAPAGNLSSGGADGLAIDLHVVVEYGLNLAEVASTLRSQVTYEVERLTGLSVAAVEVHIEDVRHGS